MDTSGSRFVARMLALCLVVCWGCQEQDTRATGAAGAPSAAPTPMAAPVGTPSNTPNTPTPAANPRSAAVTEAGLKALLNEWVSAQNAGDFSKYEALYASRFTGIKRAGSRTTRFDRKGWIADRQAMFKSPFTVVVSNEQFKVAGEIGLIEFTQTWSSAKFRDSGPKELLVTSGDKLVISREELKASLTNPPNLSRLPTPEEFSFVFDVPGRGPVLLLTDPVDLDAVTGHPEYIDDETALRPVLTKSTTPKLQSLVGQQFALYSGKGHACDATVTGLIVLTRVIPHFGTRQHWNGQLDGTQPKTPLAERATELWRMGMMAGNHLAATLSVSTCAGASFARAKSLPAPEVWSSHEPSAEELGRALARVRQTPLHRQWQADFERVTGQKEPWDSTGKPKALAFEGGKGQRFVSLAVSGGELDCGSEFGVEHWYLLKQQGSDFAVVSAGPDANVASNGPRALFGQVAFDLERDGNPELLSGFDLIMHGREGYRAVLNLDGGYFDCPC